MSDFVSTLNPGGGSERLARQALEARGRELRTETLERDLVIVGGGVAGTCAAITAARAGLKVVLVQDRPVLGGNASSEVRLWMLGATSHMGNNNRWSRESGVMGELLVENVFRNPEGNPLLVDALLLDKVQQEPNIELLLNTVVYEVEKRGERELAAVVAFCSQNSIRYVLRGRDFMDCSGDGVVSFLAGAAFRMGAEPRDEFDEGLAPTEDYGYLLGHSLYFYSKDTGRPVKYRAPSFALKDINRIPRYQKINLKEFGCKLWWVEYGGRLDTVHESEQIKWELWKVIYGIWDYIKNSGKFPESETHTLEWVGMIPGKRESRRFEGQYMMTQQDIVEQRLFDDAVAFGGWALDLHPADGVYSNKPGCSQWHSKGVYQIPLRITLPRDFDNLVLGGRIVSATHSAFGSTRVMATCGYLAQATALAVVEAQRQGISPAAMAEPEHFRPLRVQLQRLGQHIPEVALEDPDDLAAKARFSTSSAWAIQSLPADGPWQTLHESLAQMLPAKQGKLPVMTFQAKAEAATELVVELRVGHRAAHFTPDRVLERRTVRLQPGEQAVSLPWQEAMPRDDYAFVCFLAQPGVSLRASQTRATGLLTVYNGVNERVSNNGRQDAPEGSGVDSFEFWTPRRRPEGYNLAFALSEPVFTCDKTQLRSGFERPTSQPNAWIADPQDGAPMLEMRWDMPQELGSVVLAFDTDFDHAMESVLMGHPEEVMPFAVRDCELLDGEGRLVAQVSGNHQTLLHLAFEKGWKTDCLRLKLAHPSAHVPASLLAVRCYGPDVHLPLPALHV
ncbi:MAG: hypothetical protein E1N59_1325 [Puniceicoccaceae bacterium 5H]|nr:MAG: hypothetical protein E1N59_1325 [Puniceicoccaceae bacterium 5H]